MNATSQNKMEWIATKDKLPDDTERVLLFTPYQVLGDDHTCIGNKASISTCIASINQQQVAIFTHWMPLPPTPVQHA
jgi:hypothetical protein